ncbi:MAG TPA: hypothetical protein VGM88_09540 [Kofleriaceae bacterium]
MTFLASALTVAPELESAAQHAARLVSVILFDHLVRHRIMTLGDHDDERLVDDTGRILDARHPQVEDSIDWFFRVSRRHEVLWFELDLVGVRPQPAILRARRPNGAADEWRSWADRSLSAQMTHALTGWLGTRKLPAIEPLPEFTVDDLRDAAERLARVDAMLVQGRSLGQVPPAFTQPPAHLAIAFLRVLGELARDDARSLDGIILQLDPRHAVARRNRYVGGLLAGDTDRTAILPLVAEAPMYAKPHLSIWGDAFLRENAHENIGVRHQGIAASLMPANPYACHNYSLQLADDARREESYRWADRATVASPDFGAAHLDCVRRLRQVGRPGQAFAEAQYRCREILDRAAAGKLSHADWQAPHHAALLVAFAHLDVGRLAEAIELADAAVAQLPDEPTAREAFAWAAKRVAHWKTDAGLLARAYAWEGHHRGDPGRVIAGLARGRITDDDDAMMLIDALLAVGRPEQAVVAYWHCAGIDGTGVLGDGKARLAAARALILAGELDEALDQIQIAQLRRGQSRLEAEVNRTLRLAATRDAAEWSAVIARRVARGATTLARMAARDLGDFVPGVDVGGALGEPVTLAIDPLWIAELVASVPAAASSAAAIVGRLARPKQSTLAAADALATEWWTVLVPPARDRDAHASGAILALGLSLANYLVLAAGGPTPLAGAYRHIATEALHLVRRSRYQIDPTAIGALLRMMDWLGGAPEWLVDPWLLRIERALDLEAEHGAYLDGMLSGMPAVQRLLRGDERVGWELRLAHDLASDPSQYEAAAYLYARCALAVEGGSVPLAWSAAAATAAMAPEVQLDLHSLAALANPTGPMAPHLALARTQLAAGRTADGFASACGAIILATANERSAALDTLAPAWIAAGVPTPLGGAAAYDAGTAASAAGDHAAAIAHLSWAVADEPGNSQRANALAVTLGRAGRGHEALRVLARHERTGAPRLVGRVLWEAGRAAEAVPILRYAARRFRAADDWAALAGAALAAEQEAVAVEAGRRAVELGAKDPALLAGLATALYRIGEFVECERIAQRLIAGDGDRSGDRTARLAGLHAMARALAGQGRHVDALPYAKAAGEQSPSGAVGAELSDTMDRIVAQESPAVRPSVELSMERQACADLEAGRFDSLVSAISSPSWGIARAALAAAEFRREDENGIPVSPRALDASLAILARSEGTRHPDATLARIRALRVRDNAFLQIDPPPPLGARYTPEELAKAYEERSRRPRNPSAISSFSR